MVNQQENSPLFRLEDTIRFHIFQYYLVFTEDDFTASSHPIDRYIDPATPYSTACVQGDQSSHVHHRCVTRAGKGPIRRSLLRIRGTRRTTARTPDLLVHHRWHAICHLADVALQNGDPSAANDLAGSRDNRLGAIFAYTRLRYCTDQNRADGPAILSPIYRPAASADYLSIRTSAVSLETVDGRRDEGCSEDITVRVVETTQLGRSQH